MTTTTTTAAQPSLAVLLRALKLPTFAALQDEIAQNAEQPGWSFGQYLHHLAMLEVEERRRGRIARNLKASQLPGERTLATLQQQRLPGAPSNALRRRLRGAR
jgi:DNA replication protein DnaC